jgi:twitching motility protein PilT
MENMEPEMNSAAGVSLQELEVDRNYPDKNLQEPEESEKPLDSENRVSAAATAETPADEPQREEAAVAAAQTQTDSSSEFSNTGESDREETPGLVELQNQVLQLSERLSKLESNFKAQPHFPAAESSFDSALPFYFKTIKDSSSINFTLNTLLKVLIKYKASDLHIKPGVRPVVRLEGELIPVGNTVLQEADTQKLILDSMPDSVLRKFYQQGYVDYAYAIPDGRFRINAYLQRSAVSAAVRCLSADVPSFQDLNLPDSLGKIVEVNHGLILVTGPAGNGKSTTLASMIHHLNSSQKKHIITIEDPIEYVHKDEKSFISQREIGADTSSFFDALKQALRQDPNVILIGEMRDPETIWTAVMAAETGHLVLSTLHTPNAIQSIDRILDPFSGEQQRQFRELLARSLRAVVSQRLIPKADGSGRVPAVEIMITTPTIASLIAEGNTSEIYTYISQGESEGMQTFTESLTKLYQSGLVSKEIALFYAEHPTEFRLGIEGHFTGAPTYD